jgi:hypothetical protein
MDLKLFLELIAGHYVVLTGTTLALFFTTCMILLIRSIGNKNEEAQMGGVTAVIDVKEIEGAMKRVLAAQPLTVASSSVSSGARGSALCKHSFRSAMCASSNSLKILKQFARSIDPAMSSM